MAKGAAPYGSCNDACMGSDMSWSQGKEERRSPLRTGGESY